MNASSAMQRKLCSALALVGVAAAGMVSRAAAQPAAAPVEPMPLEEVASGQQGRGWSVFSGSDPEPFDVEVLGVWRQVRADESYILGRLAGQGLEESGVVAGMSGSPVYVGDRLLGAVAFSWSFAKEPIAGITPIESMRRMHEGAALPPARGVAVAAADLVAARPDERLLGEQLDLLAGPGDAGNGLLWSLSGFDGRSRQWLERSVGTTIPAGRRAATSLPGTAGTADLAPGDAVAAVLIDGDLRLAATGTVTDRDGDAVLAFGHAFLGLGDLRVPMAEAEIVTVVPSQINSFKIGNLGEIVGSFDRDRPAGIRGRIGLASPMIPLTVEVVGAATEERFDMRLAPVPVLTGALAATAVLGAIDTVEGAGGERSVDLEATVQLAGRRPLPLRQSFDGPTAGLDAAVHLLAIVGFVLNNPLAELEVERLDVRLALTPEPRLTRVVAAHPARRIVAPGETLEVRVDLEPRRGERYRESVTIDLPRDVDDGRYVLLIGDGTTIDAVRIDLEKFAPRRIEQALEFLGGLRSRSDLSVLGIEARPGLAVGGEAMPGLPGSIRDLWQASGTADAQPLTTAVRRRWDRSLDVPLQGVVRVDLEVRRP